MDSFDRTVSKSADISLNNNINIVKKINLVDCLMFQNRRLFSIFLFRNTVSEVAMQPLNNTLRWIYHLPNRVYRAFNLFHET